MEVTVTKLTDEKLMQQAFQATSKKPIKRQITLEEAYRWKHSPIRTQLFAINCTDIPSFVATHFSRHTHYDFIGITTNRDDRGGEDLGRETPVNMMIVCNAEVLMTLARKRLCTKAHKQARLLMQKICFGVQQIDPALAKNMVVECEYRGGICYEPSCCGRNVNYFAKNI